MQRSQPKTLGAIANAPRYVKNHTLHTDFNIPYVSDVIHERINKHHNNLEAHSNPLLESLLQPVNTKRLKRCWPLDLTRHLNWHRWMNTLPRHSNTWYCSVLCVIIALPHRLHSFWLLIYSKWPPLWSRGQSFWLHIQRSRVWFPALSDFLSSNESGTGSTQPREVNWGATWIKSSGSGPENRD